MKKFVSFKGDYSYFSFRGSYDDVIVIIVFDFVNFLFSVWYG